jgi:hypothetical protein
MIIASALLLVAAQSGDIEKGRVQLANCVAKMTIEHLGKKTPKPLFEDAASSACTKQKEKYMTLIKADELQFGSSDSEAREYAKEEADNVVDSFVSAYDDYLETGTIPSLE